MEHRLGDDPQGHEKIVPLKVESYVLLDVDPRSFEEGHENIVPPKGHGPPQYLGHGPPQYLLPPPRPPMLPPPRPLMPPPPRPHMDYADDFVDYPDDFVFGATRPPSDYADDYLVGAALPPSSSDDDEEICRHPELRRGLPEVYGHFKVPHQLRQVNETAYEPQLISIGPCHRHKEHLRDMELIKMQCFSRLLKEKGKKTMNRCLAAISNMEEEALDWYVAMSNMEEKVRDWFAIMSNMEEKFPIRDWFATMSNMEEKAFPLMILVDGCFIIQFLCKKRQDQFANLRWSRLTLLGDLLLLENQLPFFVLVKLYGLIKGPEDGRNFAPQALKKFIEVLPGPRIGAVNLSTIKDTNEINHLLGLVHDNWIPSRQGIERHGDYIRTGKGLKRRVERQSIGCARELEEAGIEFIKVEERNVKSLFDVDFKDGKMKIPELVIEDNTERFFRNLIAYELFVEGSTYVIDYVTLMDNLVNTANDVQLLRSCGVIENMLGDDKAVAQMLNKLRDYVTLCGDTFFYDEIFVNVKKHCERPWNTWKAKLRHDYFSNPWARIAFVAGLLVFLTTITTFILSFFKKN